MWIEKGKVKIFFDKKIKIAHGELYGIYIDPEMNKETGLVITEGQEVNINTMHWDTHVRQRLDLQSHF